MWYYTVILIGQKKCRKTPPYSEVFYADSRCHTADIIRNQELTWKIAAPEYGGDKIMWGVVLYSHCVYSGTRIVLSDVGDAYCVFNSIE